MSNPSDFVIENGVLKKYVGPGGDAVIPEGVTSIGKYSFYICSSLTSVTIPTGVTSIGESAFFCCSGLKSVTIPKSVIVIGKDAFSGCKNLTEITIPEAITELEHGVFFGCESLKKLCIPEGVTRIGDTAFADCCELSELSIPDSVVSIGNSAFAGCAKLVNLTIPKGVTSIGAYAFNNTGYAKDESHWEKGGLYIGNALIEVSWARWEPVEVKDGTIVIAEGAFGGTRKHGSAIPAVKIPDSVTSIGSWAFAHCGSLKEITIPKSVTSFGNHVLEDCPSLQVLFAPGIPFSALDSCGQGLVAARTFLTRSQEYSDPGTVEEYVNYIAAKKKKLLPELFSEDAADVLKLLVDAKKITKKNIVDEYLQPARQCKAEKCIVLLESFAEAWNQNKKQEPRKNLESSLWDGVHFSLDGKQLLKYLEEPGRVEYRVPNGTKVICAGAFIGTSIYNSDGSIRRGYSTAELGTSLEKIYLPESVTTIRRDAFCTKEGVELFIALPSGLKSVPLGAFWCDADNLINVLTASKKIADSLGEDRRANCIYTGGPLDDLSPKAKPFAVQGFLYAEKQMPEVIREWRSSYLDHIKRNEQTYVKKAVKDGFLLRLMLDEKLLSQNGVAYLLEKLPKKKRAEMTAALLAYQEAQFGKDDPEKEFSLSDSDPKMKRALDMTARREQLKEQKGISGIAFVSTGALQHFGKYNEYIDVFDLSDLKAFIEARGGFYRGAVSSKTDYLICNDPNSNSTKSQKAKELGVPVITEEEFLKMANETE